MNVARAQDRMNTLAWGAARTIDVNTGRQAWLLQQPQNQLGKTPCEMLRLITNTLGLEPHELAAKTRKRHVVEARFIAAMMLRKYYPYITLAHIAGYFGRQDHSTVINGLQTARELLAANDLLFTMKYKLAQQTIHQWLEKE